MTRRSLRKVEESHTLAVAGCASLASIAIPVGSRVWAWRGGRWRCGTLCGRREDGRLVVRLVGAETAVVAEREVRARGEGETWRDSPEDEP